MIDPTGRPVRPRTWLWGLISAMPADLPEVQEEEGNLNARKAAIILVRMEPQEIVSQQGTIGTTAASSPSQDLYPRGLSDCALYEQRTHHLLCPCHQSTFDLADLATSSSGPRRRLPQLPITIDPEGFLVAVDGFAEPVGPSFWERGDACATVKTAGKTAGWVDDRFTSSNFLKRNIGKVFPEHWSFMLGEIALYSFIVVMLSRVYLTLFFKPSMIELAYNGSYVPLKGVKMTEAYASTLNISFDIRGGLLMRQIHHWSALFFVAAISVHLLRVFFTGAFRKPRELNWVIGVGLLTMALLGRFRRVLLPDDLLGYRPEDRAGHCALALWWARVPELLHLRR